MGELLERCEIEEFAERKGGVLVPGKEAEVNFQGKCWRGLKVEWGGGIYYFNTGRFCIGGIAR